MGILLQQFCRSKVLLGQYSLTSKQMVCREKRPTQETKHCSTDAQPKVIYGIRSQVKQMGSLIIAIFESCRDIQTQIHSSHKTHSRF